jgi:hypothetical protein
MPLELLQGKQVGHREKRRHRFDLLKPRSGMQRQKPTARDSNDGNAVRIGDSCGYGIVDNALQCTDESLDYRLPGCNPLPPGKKAIEGFVWLCVAAMSRQIERDGAPAARNQMKRCVVEPFVERLLQGRREIENDGRRALRVVVRV